MDNTPLDVCANITPNGSCLTEEGPLIKIYLKRHPTEKHRNIATVVLEDMFSKEFVDRCEGNLNKLKFLIDGNRILRFSTVPIENEEEQPYPMVTFGDRILRVYEATKQTEFEAQLMKMGNLLFSWMNEAKILSLSKMKDSLLSKTAESLSDKVLNASKVTDCAHHSTDVFQWPVSEPDKSLKVTLDSQVWVAANNRSYTLHSDTDPDKPCNHDDSFIWSHKEAMEIVTMAFAKPNEEGEKLHYPIASLIHAKKGNEDVLCEVIGFFCSKARQFVSWNSNVCGIPLGTQCHMHIQLAGGQGHYKHAVVPETNMSVQRIVASFRSLKPQQRTFQMRSERVVRNISNVHRKEEHVHGNICSVLNGHDRFVAPLTEPVPAVENPNKKKKPNRTTKLELPKGRHTTDSLLNCEKANRRCIFSKHRSFDKSTIARCSIAVKQYMKYNTTVIYETSEGLHACIGPFVYKDPSSKTGYRRVPIGGDINGKLLDLSSGIVSNKHNHQVMNPKLCDVLCLKRIAKNSYRLAETLSNIIKNPSSAKLIPIDVRGKGGAMAVAGQQEMLLNSKHSTTTAPNYILASNQDPFSNEAKCLFSCYSNQQCVNVFVNHTYIGLYEFDNVGLRKMNKEMVLDQLEKINKYLPILHERYPKYHKSNKITCDIDNSDMRELSSMFGVGIWSELNPIDPYQCENSKTSENKDMEWRVVNLKEDDIDMPRIWYDSKYENDIFLMGENGAADGFNMLSRLIEEEPLGFLTDSARDKILAGHPEKNQYPQRSNLFFRDETVEEVYPTFNDVLSISIHSAGVTNEKAFDREIISPCKQRINTPKKFLLKETRSNFEMDRDKVEYEERLNYFNLKGLITRSTHPPTLLQDPSVIMAQYATRSEDAKLQELTPSLKWKYRNGFTYIIGDHAVEAWNIIFQCIVCALIQPSSLLYIEKHYKGHDELLLSPRPDQLDDFISTIRGIDNCNSRLRHHIMRKIIKDEDQLIELLKLIKLNGKTIFYSSIVDNLDNTKQSNRQLSRAQVARTLYMALNKISDVQFNHFHVQVMMRTIECCIHEPFGEVITVTGGKQGSEDAASALLRSHKSDLVAYHIRRFSANKCQILVDDNNSIEDVSYPPKANHMIKLTPGWLVEQFNARAQAVLDPNSFEDDILLSEVKIPTKQQLLSELSVLGLRWHPKLECLVHSNGIGKKFDASDTEHCDCALKHARSMALPSNNNQNEHSTTAIDGEKFVPVVYTVGEGNDLAMDHPFMSTLKEHSSQARDNYRRLLFDPSYNHCKLSDYFRVDHTC